MELNVENIRCVSQIALLGAVTPNLRGVEVQFGNKKIKILFYYNENYSEEEDEEAEMAGTELISSFTDCMLEVEKFVYPCPKKILVKGLLIYHRYEPLPSFSD